MRILVVEDERLLCDGIAEDLELEKYTVDVLGEYHKVGKEKRLGFENMRR